MQDEQSIHRREHDWSTGGGLQRGELGREGADQPPAWGRACRGVRRAIAPWSRAIGKTKRPASSPLRRIAAGLATQLAGSSSRSRPGWQLACVLLLRPKKARRDGMHQRHVLCMLVKGDRGSTGWRTRSGIWGAMWRSGRALLGERGQVEQAARAGRIVWYPSDQACTAPPASQVVCRTVRLLARAPSAPASGKSRIHQRCQPAQPPASSSCRMFFALAHCPVRHPRPRDTRPCDSSGTTPSPATHTNTHTHTHTHTSQQSVGSVHSNRLRPRHGRRQG